MAPPPGGLATQGNGAATASLVVGIVSLALCMAFVGGIVAVVLGVVGLGRAKERGDLDSEGHAPEIGVTYQLPTGETWSRKSKVGATKRKFAAFAKTTTWAAMKV